MYCRNGSPFCQVGPVSLQNYYPEKWKTIFGRSFSGRNDLQQLRADWTICNAKLQIKRSITSFFYLQSMSHIPRSRRMQYEASVRISIANSNQWIIIAKCVSNANRLSSGGRLKWLLSPSLKWSLGDWNQCWGDN